jgi:quercetin dioxygenase-like cupin family protein
MNLHELTNLLKEQKQSGKAYLEFIKVPSLSVGLYVLPANAEDKQKPHTEDEVYYVISGKGYVQVGEETQAVQSGSLIFVAAGVRHFFYAISEELRLLVFFAPAEYANAG